jgi:DNA invertase Pin-like site-specific DNA recombinase
MRSLRQLLDVAAQLEERGIQLHVLHQKIDTSTPAGRLTFHILASVDEFQRELIVEGTLEGLAAARARGRVGGSQPKLSPAQVNRAREMYDEKGADGKRRYTVEEIGNTFKVSRQTIYRALGKAGS